MKALNHVEEPLPAAEKAVETDPLESLMSGREATNTASLSANGVVTGELIGIADEGRTLLVTYPGQRGTGAITARSIVDLHGAHIGRQVVLMFEGGDLVKPIIMGVLRDAQTSALDARPGHVELDVDGERMTVSAKQQLVLRCGKASITLTNAGKVLIEGAYVSSRSTGVNRIKGGSVQLN